MTDPTHDQLKAAEELELQLGNSSDEDVFEDVLVSQPPTAAHSPVKPSSPEPVPQAAAMSTSTSSTSISLSPRPSSSPSSHSASPVTPSKAPSKVRAAAALFENASASSPTQSTPRSFSTSQAQRAKLSPSSSLFRSIPASGSSPSPRKLSPVKISRSPSGDSSASGGAGLLAARSKSPGKPLTLGLGDATRPATDVELESSPSPSPGRKAGGANGGASNGLGSAAEPDSPAVRVERFSDVPLTGTSPPSTTSALPLSTPPPVQTVRSASTSRRKSHAFSPVPPPVDLTDALPEPVVTPPPVGKEQKGGGFFASALGFGIPSAPSGTSGASRTWSGLTEPAHPSRSASGSSEKSGASGVSGASGSLTTVGAPAAAGGWRSTMTHFLSRSTSSTSPVPPSHSPEPIALPTHGDAPSTSSHPTPALPSVTQPARRTPTPTLTPSLTPTTTFLLQRVDSSAAARDRRQSQQAGGGEKIREGFERVRGEMEGAAREMRRERESKRATLVAMSKSPNPDSPGTPAIPGADTFPGASPLPEIEEDEVDWVFWGAVVQDFESVARTRPKELSKAIQQGIPPVIRGAIWQLMSSSKSSVLEDDYKALLKLSSPHEKSIVKDLNRTFPNHKFFQEGGGLGQEGLFMVVKAYSIYDHEVGYTQGLAFIVAALLLNMPDEEAFCVLVRLMDSYNLRSHYTAEMQGLQLRLFQFDRLVEEILPLTHTHFVRKGIKSSMYASQWFMTLFSYRFPLSLVYRVLDIVFAEGIEAIFRFSLALLAKSEDKLVELEFEQILNFLQSDLFEVYRAEPAKSAEERKEKDEHAEEEWKANEFVRDAYEIRITPFMLDAYAAEWDEQCRNQNRHALEVDQLRNVNRNLSSQVKQLEASLASMNQEHVDIVRQLVMCKIEKEETENELVRYKMLYAELAHAQQDAMSITSRLSGGSLHSSQAARQ
ncbi:hypothetical protein IAT38_002365 [Cryptococcus sp. DSM 104549]